MQEEVENKTLTLVISGTKFSGQMLKTAIGKYLAYRSAARYRKQNGSVTRRGKQTVKQLIGQGEGVNTIELDDPSIRDFDRIARKYGVDYAVKRDRSAEPPKLLIFFKARDADAITAAFQDYARAIVKKASRPSVRERLAQFRDMIKEAVKDKEKHREPVR